MGMTRGILLALLASFLVVQAKDYSGYRVLRTEALSKENVEKLAKFRDSKMLNKMEHKMDFWTEPRVGRSLDISVPPHQLPFVESWLKHYNIEFTTMVADLEGLIQETKPKVRTGKPEGARYTLNWDDYYEHEYLNEFIETLAAENDFASIIDIGQSYEGRDKGSCHREGWPWSPKCLA